MEFPPAVMIWTRSARLGVAPLKTECGNHARLDEFRLSEAIPDAAFERANRRQSTGMVPRWVDRGAARRCSGGEFTAAAYLY
jgi:hypothetical protein